MSARSVQPSRQALVWAGMLTIYIIWGSTYLAIRFAIETLPPLLMAAARFLVAGALLYAWRRAAGDERPTRRQWVSAAIIGLFLLLGGNGMVVIAEQRVASGIAALLVGTTPLWFVTIDAVLQRRLPHWMTVLGIVVGFIGIAVLINPWQTAAAGEEIHLVSALLVVLGALLWASGSIYTRSAVLPASPLLGTSMEMIAGGAALLLAGSLRGEWALLDPAAISLRSALGLGYLVVFGSLVAFTAYTWLLRNASTTLVSTYAYVNPVVAILLGAAFAAEQLNLRILIASAIIISAVVLITRAQARGRGG